MFRKLATGFVVIVLALSALTSVRYAMWRAERIESLQSRSQIVETRVGEIEYILEGEAGPVLLFVHGTPGGYDQAPTDYEGFRILAPSRPGYLSTPIEVGQTSAEQAEAYRALLDALDIQEVIVMGASGGGPSAITFAASHPDRVRALIAMEAVSQSMDLLEAPAFLTSDFLFWLVFDAIELGPGFEGILAKIVPNPENSKLILDDPETLERVKAVLWSGWPPSLRNDGFENDNVQFADLDLPLADVAVPTLIFHGTADINVPYGHAEFLSEQISGARLHTIANADHMMPFTHAQEIRTILQDFLAQLED